MRNVKRTGARPACLPAGRVFVCVEKARGGEPSVKCKGSATATTLSTSDSSANGTATASIIDYQRNFDPMEIRRQRTDCPTVYYWYMNQVYVNLR
ncbi:hypothetical protein T09_4225 [Trichinella sp. T9]|nr:hypothetical protein T09_4225 [Trichinella sp. T9]